MEVTTRHPLSMTFTPDREWAAQQLRNLIMDLSGRIGSSRSLVRGWDATFTSAFVAIFASEGVRPVKISPPKPRADCFAGRWMRSADGEYTDRILITANSTCSPSFASTPTMTIGTARTSPASNDRPTKTTTRPRYQRVLPGRLS
jgi:hypothetical protein